jgi:hypothetical protein
VASNEYDMVRTWPIGTVHEFDLWVGRRTLDFTASAQIARFTGRTAMCHCRSSTTSGQWRGPGYPIWPTGTVSVRLPSAANRRSAANATPRATASTAIAARLR